MLLNIKHKMAEVFNCDVIVAIFLLFLWMLTAITPHIFHTAGEIYPSTQSEASPVEYLVGSGSQEADA